MPTPSQLKELSDALEAVSGQQIGNLGEEGWWHRIALAAEGYAGTTSNANRTLSGYMLRTARALEGKSGTSGAEETVTERGLMKRIVDALEGISSTSSGGSLDGRMVAAARAGVALPPVAADRIAEIFRMTGDREPLVPQTYHQRVASDAFTPTFHPVGDPLVPTCVIYTHKAVKSGRWSDATVWDTGAVPGANAVVCSGPYDLTYDVLSDVLIKDIHINGQGSFTVDPTVQTRLWVDTFLCDGKLIIGESQGNPIPDSGAVVGGKKQPWAEFIFWQSEAPLATARLGLNTMGPVRIHGARKEGHLQIDGSVLAGATSCTLRQNAAQAGWKVGDEIMFVGTEWSGTSGTDAQYTGPTQIYGIFQGSEQTRTNNAGFKNNQTEIRTITAVSGTTISWSTALAFDHLSVSETLPRGQNVTLNPIVACLSNSIRFRSASASDTVWTGDLANLQKRAHAMFMFSDDIQIRNAEFKNMGRTASDPSLNGVTRYASSGTSQPITNANNIHGRYALHIHRTGAYFGRKQVAVERCSVWAPTAERPIPGWAIVHHDSRAAIDECNVYNFRGAGIVSELGNEIGQWIGNVCAWGRGDGFPVSWGERAELWNKHNGHSGVGFESQARQILQQDNYASGCSHGWLFMQQDANVVERIPDGDSLRYRDPITLGTGTASEMSANADYNLDNDTYGIEQAQVPDFFRNHSWDCSNAFWKAHQQFTDRFDPTPFIIKECHWIKCARAYALINYTFHYYVYDSLWTGTGGGIASFLGPVMWTNSFINMKVKDFATGFSDQGYSIAYQGFWLEVDFANVATPFAGASNIEFGVDPTTREAWNIMGSASVTGATTGIPRAWSVIRDEDLPSVYPAAPFGPSSTERAANPTPALGGDPYVVQIGTQDTTLTPTGINQYSIRALIVDSLGYRWHGDNQTPETSLSGMSPKQSRPGTFTAFATGTDIVRRNGAFLDGGVWKSRGWFNDVDRATGEHFQWHIDFTLSGFDTGFLAANAVDPSTTNAELPLKPEVSRTTAIVVPPLHAITSSATISNNENKQLAHELTATTGTVRWAITGGTDAAAFEAVFAEGRWVLRWAGNGTMDFEAPTDSGANNVYDVQVTATDFLGRGVSQPIAVTVTDVVDGIIDPFYDDFDRAESPLDAAPTWERVGGVSNAIRVRGQFNQISSPGDANGFPTIYLAPRTGSTRHFAESKTKRSFNPIQLIVNYTDSQNFIRVFHANGGGFEIIRVLNGAASTVGSISTGWTNGDLFRAEWNPTTGQVTLYRNGTAVGTPVTVTGLPQGTRVGYYHIGNNSVAVDNWETFRSGSF